MLLVAIYNNMVSKFPLNVHKLSVGRSNRVADACVYGSTFECNVMLHVLDIYVHSCLLTTEYKVVCLRLILRHMVGGL